MAPYPPQPYPQQPYPQPPYPPPIQYAPPQGYYPPPMYPAPVYVAPPGKSTFEGLKWMKYGTALAMASNGLAVLGSLLAFSLLSSLATAGPADIFAFLGLLFALAALFLTAGILGLVGLCLGLAGYYNVHKGRLEFGEEHSKSVQKSVPWLVVACVVYLVNIVASLILSPGFAFGLADPTTLANRLLLQGAVSGSLVLAYVFSAAMFLQRVIERLATSRGRSLRPVFIVASLAGGGLTLALSVLTPLLFLDALANPQSISAFGYFTSLASLVSVATAFIYWRQLSTAEQGCKNMISSGTFDPDGGAVAPA